MTSEVAHTFPERLTSQSPSADIAGRECTPFFVEILASNAGQHSQFFPISTPRQTNNSVMASIKDPRPLSSGTCAPHTPHSPQLPHSQTPHNIPIKPTFPNNLIDPSSLRIKPTMHPKDKERIEIQPTSTLDTSSLPEHALQLIEWIAFDGMSQARALEFFNREFPDVSIKDRRDMGTLYWKWRGDWEAEQNGTRTVRKVDPRVQRLLREKNRGGFFVGVEEDRVEGDSGAEVDGDEGEDEIENVGSMGDANSSRAEYIEKGNKATENALGESNSENLPPRDDEPVEGGESDDGNVDVACEISQSPVARKRKASTHALPGTNKRIKFVHLSSSPRNSVGQVAKHSHSATAPDTTTSSRQRTSCDACRKRKVSCKHMVYETRSYTKDNANAAADPNAEGGGNGSGKDNDADRGNVNANIKGSSTPKRCAECRKRKKSCKHRTTVSTTAPAPLTMNSTTALAPVAMPSATAPTPRPAPSSFLTPLPAPGAIQAEPPSRAPTARTRRNPLSSRLPPATAVNNQHDIITATLVPALNAANIPNHLRQFTHPRAIAAQRNRHLAPKIPDMPPMTSEQEQQLEALKGPILEKEAEWKDYNQTVERHEDLAEADRLEAELEALEEQAKAIHKAGYGQWRFSTFGSGSWI
ncbi:hypothetical protein CC80DRAFT_566861 [Byssothecium circinans]|uniref:Zn(2)-C6 fungal-type domain-containing protein n=1 Tax=Byssothecium circinans TaxID=147558 RepID=A0A6A5TS83_9PLEO|nr:hypothetical protein CC80DRAFT_566861 [Byssothecium circinans]